MKSIKSHPFFNRLSYSLGNEDWKTELKALQLNAQDEVLVITASGDRPLHLLLDPCKKITAIDANPVQNYLLQLKIAAIKHLKADEYVQFLGLKNHQNRLSLLEQLHPSLPEESARYWLKNQKAIKKGVIYQGAIEKWINKSAFLLLLFKSKEIKSLFAQDNLHDQSRFLSTNWSHGLWKRALNFFMNPGFSQLFLKDPGLYTSHETHQKPGNYFYDRMMEHLSKHLAKDNYFLQLIFLGSISEEAAPPYLQKSQHQHIQSNVGKIHSHTGDVIEYLENCPANTFSKFSLSDVASYMPYEQFTRLLKAIHHAAKPHARICLRQFMSRYRIPSALESHFNFEPDLQHQLEKEDRTFVYHFTVGTVNK